MPKCNICGAELTPGAKFCTDCGTPVPQDASPAPEQPTPVATAFNQAVGSSASGQTAFSGQPPVGGQPDFNGQQPVGGQPGAGSFYYGQPASPQKKKTGLIAAIIAAVVAVIVIIVIVVVVLSNRNTYKTPIEKFEKGINNRDTSTLLEAFPIDPKYKSLYKLAGDSFGDELLSSFDSEYDGCKVRIEINDTERLTSSELSDAADSYLASSFGDDYDLTEGYYVYCTVKTIGNGNSESENSTITVCKWDGKWYIFGLN